MDRCTNCPKTKKYPHEDTCPICGATAVVDYSEPSVIWNCSKCGGLVGNGLWTECSQDNRKYTTRISRAKYSQKQIMLISKQFNLNSVDVYKKIADEQPLECSLSLFDVISAIRIFRDAEIDCEVTPRIEYSRIFICH